MRRLKRKVQLFFPFRPDSDNNNKKNNILRMKRYLYLL